MSPLTGMPAKFGDRGRGPRDGSPCELHEPRPFVGCYREGLPLLASATGVCEQRCVVPSSVEVLVLVPSLLFPSSPTSSPFQPFLPPLSRRPTPPTRSLRCRLHKLVSNRANQHSLFLSFTVSDNDYDTHARCSHTRPRSHTLLTRLASHSNSSRLFQLA